MVIDSHVHVWAIDPIHYPWQPILGYVPNRPAPVEALVGLMDSGGVDGAVLVQPSVYGWDHRYLFHALDAFPNRFVGVGLLDHEDAAWPRRLEGLVERRLAGVRFNLVRDQGTTWINRNEHRRLWSTLIAHRLPASFQVRYDHLRAISALAIAHAELEIVVDHLGRPDLAAVDGGWQDLLALAARPNIRIKLSSFHNIAAPGVWDHLTPLLRDCVEAFGCSRLMWGSDAPGALTMVDYGETMAPIDMLELDSTDRGALMGETAAQVFGFHRPVRTAPLEAERRLDG